MGVLVEPRAGTGYRLPTEAEWEYACRAGTTTTHFFGNFSFGSLPDAVSRETTVACEWGSANAQGTPHPVGLLRPNPFGLYDMHGNVGEWCADWLNRGEYATRLRNAKGVENPSGPRNGKSRVYRGGYFGLASHLTRSADRGQGMPPTEMSSVIGFRVVLPVSTSEEEFFKRPEKPTATSTPP